MITRPWYVGVAGLMGSGKTTLARGLASSLGWSYLPEPSRAIKYLRDLFADPARWAFPTQVGFFVTKALQIQEALSGRSPIILDRTLYEDAEIFERYFHDRNEIDGRSHATYLDLVEHFSRMIPQPDVIIYCRCSWETASKRMRERPKEFTLSYPPGHLEEIAQRYERWIENFRRSSVVIVDTEMVDTRKSTVVERVRDELLRILLQVETAAQADLFIGAPEERPTEILHLKYRQPPAHPFVSRPVVGPQRARVTPFPTAYLAAPFTGYSSPPEQEKGTLLPIELPHGTIPHGPYRKFLTDVEKALKKLGISTFIPHRDINEWGKRILTAPEVMHACSDYVGEADLFVGLLGMSHGSHYEFGVAHGMGKPCILLRCGQVDESFVASGVSGLANHERVLIVEGQTFSEISALLTTERIRTFLRRFLPTTEAR